jgi:hypothetical protein
VHLGRAWRIEFSYRNIHEYMYLARSKRTSSGGCPPICELVLLTAPNIRAYFYTKIRFSTPGSKFSCINLGSKSSCWPNVPVLKVPHIKKCPRVILDGRVTAPYSTTRTSRRQSHVRPIPGNKPRGGLQGGQG